MRTNFYVDGFNLYYRAVKDTPYKWLDLLKLCQTLIPTHQVNLIRYFTALIRPRPESPGSRRRQLVFIRALETIPNLTIHYGQFRERRIRRPLVAPTILVKVERWKCSIPRRRAPVSTWPATC